MEVYLLEYEMLVEFGLEKWNGAILLGTLKLRIFSKKRPTVGLIQI